MDLKKIAARVKGSFKSKSQWFNGGIMVALLAALSEELNSINVNELDVRTGLLVAIAAAAVNFFYLRPVTTTPLEEK